MLKKYFRPAIGATFLDKSYMLIGALYSGGHVENDEIFPGSDHTFEGKRAFGEMQFMYKRYDTF